jgi:hypothetical protein
MAKEAGVGFLLFQGALLASVHHIGIFGIYLCDAATNKRYSLYASSQL